MLGAAGRYVFPLFHGGVSMKVSMIIGIIVITLFLLFGIISGGSLALFINIPSALIVGGVLIGGSLMSFGFAVPLRAMKEALWGRGVQVLDELKIYVNFFNLASQLSIAGGVAGTLIGFIQILAKMNDPSSIGPAMAVALITVMYGVVLSEFMFQPLKHALITKSADECENADNIDSGQSNKNRWLVLGLGTFVGVVSFLILMISIST
ncbi:MotA/TolQ/ExbB proton channel family protein [Candidatus Latescibacterota bacterium]